MTKELFVSSTPHETKVGMVEDDQLAEIYLERENEYTLAGSIYKGRVTRVLPGMQSAFVDIGLERDAFLYVSDFMELGEDQDDLEEVPTNRPVPAQAYQEPPRTDFGPPPGYQPIILPGESISKYQRLVHNPVAPASEERAPEAQETPLAQMFPEDEPLFAKGRTDENFSNQEQPEPAEAAEASFKSDSPEWDREQKRLHEMNVAAVFGGEERENRRNEERNTVGMAGSAGTMEEEEIEEIGRASCRER